MSIPLATQFIEVDRKCASSLYNSISLLDLADVYGALHPYEVNKGNLMLWIV